MGRWALVCSCAALLFSCGGSDERLVMATVSNTTLGKLTEVRVSFWNTLEELEYHYDWTAEPKPGQSPGRGEEQTLAIPLKSANTSGFSIVGLKDGAEVSEPLDFRWLDQSRIFETKFTLAPEFSRQNGRPCASVSSCASGFCVDGVCCNSACDGVCRRCGFSGSCEVLSSRVSDSGTCEAPKECSSGGVCMMAPAPNGVCSATSDCRGGQICFNRRCL